MLKKFFSWELQFGKGDDCYYVEKPTAYFSKVKKNGLTITQVDKIANVISANENAIVEVTLPKYTRTDQAMVGEIYIKSDKKL